MSLGQKKVGIPKTESILRVALKNDSVVFAR